MPSWNPKENTAPQNINIARGFFATLAGLLALTSLIVLGTSMDYANFPGSNLVLAEYNETDERSGLIALVDGFELVPSTCSNSKVLKNNQAPHICGSVEDGTAKTLDILDDDGKSDQSLGAHGWILAPPCAKTADVNVCAPFGFSSALSGLGQATFGVLAINVVLFGAHTGLELKLESLAELKSLGTKSVLFALNIVWTIIALSLYVWAAIAWGGMCDKIDAGLGRHVKVGKLTVSACATSYCTISYGGFMASFVVALVFARIPNILMFFGIGGLEEAGYGAVDDDDL